MSEAPNEREYRSPLEAGNLLYEELEAMLQMYRAGQVEQHDLLKIVDTLQKLNYEQLSKKFPTRYHAPYDDVAQSCITDEGNLYSLLLSEHPVTKELIDQALQKHDFQFWHAVFTENIPEIDLPVEGTPTDLFKAVLRHYISIYASQLDARTIAIIEIEYIMKKVIEPREFILAETLIHGDLEA